MRLFLVVCATLIAVVAPAQDQTKATTPAFPGTYAQLKPQQKKLIDEWYAEYDKLMHENDPPTDYDQLSPSTPNHLRSRDPRLDDHKPDQQVRAADGRSA